MIHCHFSRTLLLTLSILFASLQTPGHAESVGDKFGRSVADGLRWVGQYMPDNEFFLPSAAAFGTMGGITFAHLFASSATWTAMLLTGAPAIALGVVVAVGATALAFHGYNMIRDAMTGENRYAQVADQSDSSVALLGQNAGFAEF